MLQRRIKKKKVRILKSARNKETNTFKCGNEYEEMTMTSYKISHLLARNIKPYPDREIMQQAIVMFGVKCCSISIQLKAKYITA